MSWVPPPIHKCVTGPSTIQIRTYILSSLYCADVRYFLIFFLIQIFASGKTDFTSILVYSTVKVSLIQTNYGEDMSKLVN